MSNTLQRRQFLSSTAAGLGAFSFLDALPTLQGSMPESRQLAAVAQEIEPLVRLIEDTPRAELVGKIIDRIRTGTSYQELLSAVYLAGVRNIQPRPVGFKFHAVLVIHAAHQASLASTDKDRWLPLLWSIDYFKSAQQTNKTQGDWRMTPVDESKLPDASQARQRFIEAMDNWDVEGADRAVTAWARCGSLGEIFEVFWRYGARDFRDIGHKAIFVANAWRVLQAIGTRHAEPVLRSLAYALLDHEGTNPAKRDDPRDRSGRDNLARLGHFKSFRHSGKLDTGATNDLLAGLRKATPAEGSQLVLEQLQRGVHPENIWSGLFLAGGELLMRQPGIVALHALTSVNALRFAYDTAADPTNRAFVLLQGGAFLGHFLQAMRERGKLSERRVDTLEPTPSKGDAVVEILADVSRDRQQAASKTLALLQRQPEQLPVLMREIRRTIFAKGTDSHDYKFSSAILEDALHLPNDLRARYLAASMYQLRGSGDRDNALIQRARAALQG